MLSEKMQDALNGQINAELYSSYLYLAMSAYFESVNLRGAAKWMRVQAAEENAHAMRIYDHVIGRGGRATLKAIDAPPAKWDSPLAAFRAAHAHEVKVTGMIHRLVELAESDKDPAARGMLQWFVDEQVEEEASVEEIVQKLTMIKDSPNGLFMMDHRLGERGSEGD